MNFSDEGYIINLRKHGERSLILTVLTRTHGKVVGYAKNCLSKKNLAAFQLGNQVRLEVWARVDENMPVFKTELVAPTVVGFINSEAKLRVLSSFCALCNACMPELQNLESFYDKADDFFKHINEDNWLAYYSYFEFYLLDFLGIGLDLNTCAVTGRTENLAYVSPKSGRAVCADAGAPYRQKLFGYPQFIRTRNYRPTSREVSDLLQMTEFFLNKNFFAAHGLKFPQCRVSLGQNLKLTAEN